MGLTFELFYVFSSVDEVIRPVYLLVNIKPYSDLINTKIQNINKCYHRFLRRLFKPILAALHCSSVLFGVCLCVQLLRKNAVKYCRYFKRNCNDLCFQSQEVFFLTCLDSECLKFGGMASCKKKHIQISSSLCETSIIHLSPISCQVENKHLFINCIDRFCKNLSFEKPALEIGNAVFKCAL